MLECRNYRGTIALFGTQINDIGEQFKSMVPHGAIAARDKRDGAGVYHITIVSSSEQTGGTRNWKECSAVQEEIKIVAVGTTGLERGEVKSWYAVMYCPWANKLRTQMGLEPKELHITLGFIGGDLYGEPSLYNAINWCNELPSAWMEIVELVASNRANASKKHTGFQSVDYKIMQHAVELFSTIKVLTAEVIRTLRSIAAWALQGKFSEGTVLALDIGYLLLGRGVPLGIHFILSGLPEVTNISDLSTHLPVTLARGGNEIAQRKMIRDCNVTVMQRGATLSEKNNNHQKSHQRRHVLSIYRGDIALCLLQRNFSWVSLHAHGKLYSSTFGDTENRRYLPYLLAGSAIPTQKEHLSAMSGLGIRHIITVHEGPLPSALCRTVPVGPEFALRNEVAHASHTSAGEVVSYHFHVMDRTPPSSAQLSEMCELIHSAVLRHEGVLVHCQGGVGRTNTVIIAYLMWAQGLSAVEATTQVTAQRTIILSQSQKNTLQRWWKECNELRTRRQETETNESIEAMESNITNLSAMAVSSEKTNSNNAPLSTVVDAGKDRSLQVPVPATVYRRVASAVNMPPLIVLCGYAASGKSTFATALSRHSKYFVRINKDEMRAKNQCEDVLFDALTVIAKNLKTGGGGKKTPAAGGVSPRAGTVVIDCCNLSVAKRKEWLQLAHNPRAWCVFFDLPLMECKDRITKRSGHPTIQSGPAGVRILDSMEKMLQPPTAESASKEGFEKLIVVHTGEEAFELLRSWKITIPEGTVVGSDCACVGGEGGEGGEEDQESSTAAMAETSDALLKFPRTAHIMNLGAATRDDKVLGSGDIAALVGRTHRIIVEEKLDGANMGIFISQNDNKIMVQNRSHFVSSNYHPQFAPLDRWLVQHTADLWAILTPGRHILYGEWLYATHSVKYTHLPAWFVAYDLYDRVTQQFASREVLAALLATTSIPHVPLIYDGQVETVEQLKAFVHGGSAFNTERREGVVVRVCVGDRLLSRAKLVRSDFIAGNERWNKSAKLETNSLAPSAMMG